MCHRVSITLSAEERAAARKVVGFLIPVYASVVLAAIAVVAVGGAPRQNEQIAATAVPVSAR
jgi:hypothetical protein